MTGGLATLERVESFLPGRAVAVGELAGDLGLSKAKLSLFQKVHGLRTLRVDPELGLLDLVLPAARRVVESLADPARVRHVVHAHATHEVSPPLAELPGRIRDELGLSGAQAFGLTQQNCAVGLGAIDVAAALLRAGAEPGARALVVTGEKAFSRIIGLLPNTAIMGEAAAACLVALDGDGDPVTALAGRTLGQYAELVSLSPEEAARFGKDYAPVLAEVMRDAVAAAGLELSDIEMVIPHNVNMHAWRQTIDELRIPPGRVFLDNIARYSHCFASDVFVNYTTLRDAGRLTAGGHYLLAAVGAGASFKAAVLTHRGER
ncbi:3-oxoacyl-ACP synthase [Saccharopolyspora erythraea]|uniref:3-oxoacyl-[acyl-carrier-protein] synthase III C-terminal domain-containing protein n=1 Tax=Saccharopolyspora erythraea TaxID=1836 RepID=UPI001BF1310E|nr:3-oxoacyl-[acyl-carrier-protein] synthase III C-terminal domain-containing protein [Saccharopolyspora erythraea]QUH01515.1 3-oxoacyl-ACP synthase [Saccharopolyspora erythraea]